jgi:hypothetical protein
MKKILVLILTFFLSAFCFAAVSVTFVKDSVTVNTDAKNLYDYLNKGWTLQNEALVIRAMYNNNAIRKTTTGVPSIAAGTYTATTFTASSTTATAASVRNALAQVKIGSIVETAHDTPLFGIVRGLRGNTIMMNNWYNLTTTVAITPSPTTGKALSIYGYEEITNIKISGKALKLRKYTTTSAISGSATTIAHGLTGANILGVQARALVTTNAAFIPNSTTASNIYLYEVYYDDNNITIFTNASGSAIESKPVSVLLTYEE